jgi:hypothetical protein
VIQLPTHYQTTFRTVLRFAVVFIILGLLTGVLYQESSKKLPEGSLPFELVFQGNYSLSLIHGHTFLIGVLIPVGVAFMLTLGLVLGAVPIGPKALKWGYGLYLPNAAVAVGLLIYKAYHTQISVRLGQTDLQAVNHAMFGGIEAIRHAAYGLSHTLMAVGLITLAVALWKSLSKKPFANGTSEINYL